MVNPLALNVRALALATAIFVHAEPFDDRWITYPVIAEPPLLVGADQLTFTCPEPTPDAGATTAVTDCGAPGFVRGVADTVAEAVSPTAFRARTRKW